MRPIHWPLLAMVILLAGVAQAAPAPPAKSAPGPAALSSRGFIAYGTDPTGAFRALMPDIYGSLHTVPTDGQGNVCTSSSPLPCPQPGGGGSGGGTVTQGAAAGTPSSSSAWYVQGVTGGTAVPTTDTSTRANDTAGTNRAQSHDDTIAAAQAGTGLKTLAAPLQASGVTPVTGTFTATGTSAAFTPQAGRSFNVAVWNSTTPGAALSGTVYLARSIDGGTVYLPLTANGTQLESITTTASESWSESQAGVTYQLVCSAYTSGTINYRMAQ